MPNSKILHCNTNSAVISKGFSLNHHHLIYEDSFFNLSKIPKVAWHIWCLRVVVASVIVMIVLVLIVAVAVDPMIRVVGVVHPY